MTARDACMDAQRALCDEFAGWAARQGLAYLPDADDPLVLNLMSREQRRWLISLIARWDWSCEQDARNPASLRTGLELAGELLAVARENCCREEFDAVMSGGRRFSDFLDIPSLLELAFARLHRVPVGGHRTLDQLAAEQALKAEALQIVSARCGATGD